jgi:hypothetical protein
MNFYSLNEKINNSNNLNISDNLKYHIENKIPIHENIFRVHSKSYYELIKEAKTLYLAGKLEVSDEDKEFLETDIGETALYKGKLVYLDSPKLIKVKIDENKKGKRLNSPFRTPGEGKKFAVYVKTPSGNIKKVRFGDPKLKIKNSNKKRAKSFRARHKCSEKKDRTKAGYWSCNVGRYAKSLGLSSSTPW